MENLQCRFSSSFGNDFFIVCTFQLQIFKFVASFHALKCSASMKVFSSIKSFYKEIRGWCEHQMSNNESTARFPLNNCIIMKCTGCSQHWHKSSWDLLFSLAQLVAQKGKKFKLKLNSWRVFPRWKMLCEITASGMFNYINQSWDGVGSERQIIINFSE